MDKYIKFSDALKAVSVDNLISNLDSVIDEYYNMYHRAAERAIAGVPIADVRPVVRGKWITYNNTYVCSVCGISLSFWKSRYCPNCGARMVECDEWQ